MLARYNMRVEGFFFSFLKLLSHWRGVFYVAVFSKTLDYPFTEDEGLFSRLVFTSRGVAPCSAQV